MQEILDMSVAERILIIEQIWDSIDHQNITMPVTHAQELDRRLNRHENGETKFVTWNSIKSELDSCK